MSLSRPTLSGRERQGRFTLSDVLLAAVPLGDSGGLLPGENREEQMWKAALPREGFGLVERELEDPRLLTVQPLEFTFDNGADCREGIAHVTSGLAMVSVHISFGWLTEIEFQFTETAFGSCPFSKI